MSEDYESTTEIESRPVMKRILRAILLYVVVPYVAVTLIMATLQRRLMYQPTVADSLSISDVGLNDEFGLDVELTTDDGSRLRGWLLKSRADVPQDDGAAALVLYFPGNAGNRSKRIDDLREFTACGFDVLIVDYRGYGDSTGSPSEAALSADALLVWHYARETLDYDENRIVVFGESLGGGVALSMWSESDASPPQPACVVLNSTFASMTQTVTWQYPMFPFRYLLLDHWPSIERIGRVQVPIVVFHGTDDQMIPIDHARALAAASQQARFIENPGGGHNEIPMMKLRKELDALRAVIPAAVNSTTEQ